MDREQGENPVNDGLPSGVHLWTNVIKPGLDAGKTAEEIAKEYGVEGAFVEDVIREWTIDGPILFRDGVDTLGRYFILGEPAEYRLAILWAFQSYLLRDRMTDEGVEIKGILPCSFYLGIGGAPSTGKTTLLEILQDLCWRGIMSGDATVSALTRVIDDGCTPLLDEADKMEDEVRKLVYGCARRGYRRGSKRLVSVQNGKSWEPAEIETFAAYAFSFYDPVDIDPALLTRMLKFDTVRLRTDQVAEKVFANMVRTLIGQSDLKDRIAKFCERNLTNGWTREKVVEMLEDPAFQKRALALTDIGKSMPRDIEIAAILLIVSEFIGIDLSVELKVILDSPSRTDIDAGAIDELEVIQDLFGPDIVAAETTGRDARMKQEDLRFKWNLRRRQYGDRPEKETEFEARLLRLGFQPGMELVHPKNRKYVVWTNRVAQKLSSEYNPVPNPPTNPSLTRFFASNPEVSGVRVERERVILGSIRGLEDGKPSSRIPKDGLTQDEILELLKETDPTATIDDVKRILKHFLTDGSAYISTIREGAFKSTGK